MWLSSIILVEETQVTYFFLNLIKSCIEPLHIEGGKKPKLTQLLPILSKMDLCLNGLTQFRIVISKKSLCI